MSEETAKVTHITEWGYVAMGLRVEKVDAPDGDGTIDKATKIYLGSDLLETEDINKAMRFSRCKDVKDAMAGIGVGDVYTKFLNVQWFDGQVKYQREVNS